MKNINENTQEEIEVYRLDNIDPNRGLWYNPSGEYKGEVITGFTDCKASKLEMPYDDELAKGWRSATNTAEGLLQWFDLEEIAFLEKHNFYVSVYTTRKHKIHTHKVPNSDIKIDHVIFHKEASKLKELISIEKFRKLLEQK